jgi:hypothetical protein
MAIRRYKPKQIVNLLRQIEVGIVNGKRPRKPAKKPKSQWRPTTAGGKNTAVLDQAKRLKELVREIAS